jgi:hypothetical protein
VTQEVSHGGAGVVLLGRTSWTAAIVRDCVPVIALLVVALDAVSADIPAEAILKAIEQLVSAEGAVAGVGIEALRTTRVVAYDHAECRVVAAIGGVAGEAGGLVAQFTSFDQIVATQTKRQEGVVGAGSAVRGFPLTGQA